MFTKTERGERILWCLLESDAQEIAREQIGRELTEGELVDVAKGLEFGFSDWAVIVETTVDQIVEKKEK